MESWRHLWPVETICRVMQVSPRGYRSWRTRPISQRARTDMKVLAHIREQYSLSLGSYGRPRMTMELKEAGLDVGERRVGRLMRLGAIKPVRTRRHKVTTDSNHRLGVAANWLDGDFVADMPNQKWAGDITYIWTQEGWLYLAVILDLHSRRVVALRQAQEGGQRQDEKGSGDPGVGHGCTPPQSARGLPFPFRSRQPILFLRLSKETAGLRPAAIDERQG